MITLQQFQQELAKDADEAGKEVTRQLKEMNAPDEQKKELHKAMAAYVAKVNMASMATMATDVPSLKRRLETLAR